MHDTVRVLSPKHVTGSVLLIEDDEPLARSLVRMIAREGYQTVHESLAAPAIERVMNTSFDLVISDINLAGASGVDVLNVVRAYDPDVPLAMMTGAPTMASAIEAVSLGCLEYLVKPTSRDQLLRVLARATETRRAKPDRRAKFLTAPPPAPGGRRRDSSIFANLGSALDRALTTLSVELEPVVEARTKTVIGFGTRMSSREVSLSTESALVVAADHLGRLQDLRRRVRDLAVAAFLDAEAGTVLFVDMHALDLREPNLYATEPALARIANRVVLQLRGGGAAFGVDDLVARSGTLRHDGFRISIADLDASANLAELAEVSPDFVRIEPRLVRNIHAAPERRRIVAALASMCRALDSVPIADGVSSVDERDALVEAGCDLVQGPLCARHATNAVRRIGPTER